MALANCKQCGSLFNKITRDICEKCLKEEEALLRETQDYLRDNRSAQIWQILEAIEDLEAGLLDKWVGEKRINLVKPEDEAGKKQCMYCGREVTGAGNICKTCEVKKKLSSSKPTLKKEDEGPKAKRTGMHFKR
ncbi:MAG: hypothetical protein P9L94_07695 [Candidatus Hinthialibacter antarcticus]|nr:hypothetical protein [Candidatus Hinthialibacter antarcticus]